MNMKRKYRVDWYEYDLTQPCTRRFYTELAAVVFAHFISKCQHTKARVSEA